ncbi:MAG: hypothetical protein QXT45_06330 [Candidatus Bilamarchaeaceae archaeon]
MPLTPFHLGPSLLIGLLAFRIFDFPTLLIASVIVDIEPFSVFVFNAPWPMHGFLHTFLGGSIAATCIAIIFYLPRKMAGISGSARHSSFKQIILASFFGVYSHILLDAFLYEELNPFYPFEGNPFFGLFSFQQVYLFCSLTFIAGGALYLGRHYLARSYIEREE